MIITRVGALSPLVSLAEAREWLHVDHEDEDDTITALIAAAQAHFDGPPNIYGRSISRQTLRLDLPGFPRRVRLPYGPVRAVTAVKYRDPAGEQTTLPEASYVVAATILVPTGSWPATACRPDAVSVTYSAGYEDAEVPEVFRLAIRMMVAECFNNREEGSDAQRFEVPFSVRRLLSPYRVLG